MRQSATFMGGEGETLGWSSLHLLCGEMKSQFMTYLKENREVVGSSTLYCHNKVGLYETSINMFLISSMKFDAVFIVPASLILIS